MLWLDSLKAVGILWIFMTHAAEELFGPALLGHPTMEWSSFAERTRWLQMMPIRSAWDAIANGFRTVGWSGNLSVSFFLVASGFGVTWSVFRSRNVRHGDKPQLQFGSFLRKRLSRILPLWWMAHLLLLAPVAAIGFRVSLADPEFYFSLMGIRLTARQLFYGIPAWWFIPLLLQLYLVFPFLYRWIASQPGRNASLLIVIALAIRGLGFYFFEDYLQPWSFGAIFVTRLPEFVFGIWLAFAFEESEDHVCQRFQHWWLVVASIVAMAVSYYLSVSVVGCIFVHTLFGICGFVISYNFSASRMASSAWFKAGVTPVIEWLSRHTLSIFLVHQPVVYLLLRGQSGENFGPSQLAWTGSAFAVTIVLALLLEWCAHQAGTTVKICFDRWGHTRTVLYATAIAGLAIGCLLPLELSLRKHDPQDVPDFGWGERPSLQPDHALGFRLKPSKKTRLRWESYDYMVQSNSHGFPGPEFEIAKQPNTFRVMTLGDAFTSAEGVDTSNAWPRELERKLNATNSASDPDQSPRTEIINFGITGYGPNQYQWLVQEYAPKLKPDLIVIGFFTNDFVDVFADADEFCSMIGFEKPDRNGILGYATGRHVFRRFRSGLDNLYEDLFRKPSPHTRFFAQCDMFERSRAAEMAEGQQLIRKNFEKIADVTSDLKIPVVIAMIPAPIQVMDKKHLEYLRPSIEFDSMEVFDYDQPQRLAESVAREFNFETLDLRPALKAVAGQRPYQSRNLHFTELGHTTVAAALAPVAEHYRTSTENDITAQDSGTMSASAEVP